MIPMVIGFALTFWLSPMPEPSEHACVDVERVVFERSVTCAKYLGLLRRSQHLLSARWW